MANNIAGYGNNPSDLLRTLQQMQLGFADKAAKAAIAAKVQDASGQQTANQTDITGTGRYLDVKA